jgi:hypothetical protein
MYAGSPENKNDNPRFLKYKDAVLNKAKKISDQKIMTRTKTKKHNAMIDKKLDRKWSIITKAMQASNNYKDYNIDHEKPPTVRFATVQKMRLFSKNEPATQYTNLQHKPATQYTNLLHNYSPTFLHKGVHKFIHSITSNFLT